MGSFRKRVLVLIIGLSVVTQTVTLAAVLISTRHTVEARAAEELRAQLRQAQEQTAAMQRMAQEHAQRAALAEQRAMGSTVGMIESALDAAQQAAANARAKFQAALDAVRAYRFTPATKDGHTVRVRMHWLVQFRLR